VEEKEAENNIINWKNNVRIPSMYFLENYSVVQVGVYF